ncbi:MFS transporter [Jiangella endophytica]|uniref:MFS transporter n=1 Tax=Jiangella endophytica TaxID=1623398 RepID=UPI0018E503B8|nr:MFS transporter [Jiangella endophytica]
MTTTDVVPRAGRREYAGLAVLTLPTTLVSLDMSVLYLALPHLGADLGASSLQQLWITDVYGFMVAGLLITMGTIGDRIGRRRLLLLGAAAFSLASIVAAYSTSAEMLIVSRALLGVAGATLMPSTLTLISTMFRDPRQHGMAIAIWMACFMGGLALGPIVGGVLLEHFWWGSVFLLGVPVMLLLLVTGPAVLPEYRNPAGGRLDPVSVLLCLGTVLPLVYGLKEISRDGVEVLPAAAVVVGLLAARWFVRRQRRLAEPMLDLRLFGNRTFTAGLTISTIAGIMAGSQLFVYLYLQLVAGLSPLDAALWLLPSALVTIVSLQVAPLLARRFAPARVMASGLALVAAGYVLLTLVDGSGSLELLIAGLVLTAVGIGPMAGLSMGLALGSVRPEQVGSAAAMSETAGEFGIAAGVAVMGVIGTAIYRHGADADQLPAPGGELATDVRDALAGALNGTATVSAVIAVGLGILALAGLRHVRPVGAQDPA